MRLSADGWSYRREVGDELDVDDVLAMHDRDVMDCAGREEWMDKRHGGEAAREGDGQSLSTFELIPLPLQNPKYTLQPCFPPR